jgi:hypothetical protein
MDMKKLSEVREKTIPLPPPERISKLSLKLENG